jgi:hypothetical protein
MISANINYYNLHQLDKIVDRDNLILNIKLLLGIKKLDSA